MRQLNQSLARSEWGEAPRPKPSFMHEQRSRIQLVGEKLWFCPIEVFAQVIRPHPIAVKRQQLILSVCVLGSLHIE